MSIIATFRKTAVEPGTRQRHGDHGPALTVHGKELRAGVVNDNQVRAAAGLTMVIGAAALSCAYFTRNYVPLQAVAAYFSAEFLIRVTAGLRHSPAGILARAMTRRNPPVWVSAKPKRFASKLGLAMAVAMTIITSSGVRGYLPVAMSLIFVTLMWLEAVLGLCLGCEIHGLLVRRGWAVKDPDFEVCANGACDVPEPASPAGDPAGIPARLAGPPSDGAVLTFLDSRVSAR